MMEGDQFDDENDTPSKRKSFPFRVTFDQAMTISFLCYTSAGLSALIAAIL